jgi:hypothetical protein
MKMCILISVAVGFFVGFTVGAFPWRFYFEGGTPHALVTNFQYSVERLVSRGGDVKDPEGIARHAVLSANMNADIVAQMFCETSREDRAWAVKFVRLMDKSPLVAAFGDSRGQRAREFIEAHETPTEDCRDFRY